MSDLRTAGKCEYGGRPIRRPLRIASRERPLPAAPRESEVSVSNTLPFGVPVGMTLSARGPVFDPVQAERVEVVRNRFEECLQHLSFPVIGAPGPFEVGLALRRAVELVSARGWVFPGFTGAVFGEDAERLLAVKRIVGLLPAPTAASVASPAPRRACSVPDRLEDGWFRRAA